MVSTTRPTTSPPLTAMSDALPASWLAWRALSAFCFTMLVSSSMLEAVSSSDEACSSVRCDKSALPAAICLVALAMESAELLMLVIVPVSCCCICAMAKSMLSWSPGRVCTCTARSPAAMRRAISAAYEGSPPNWRDSRRAMTRPSTMPSSAPAQAITIITRRERCASSRALTVDAAETSSTRLTILSSVFSNAAVSSSRPTFSAVTRLSNWVGSRPCLSISATKSVMRLPQTG